MLVRSQMVPLAELIMKQGLVWSWASAEIFPGGARSTCCLYFQIADDAIEIGVHKTLYLF